MRVGLLTTGYPRWEGDVAGSFVAGFAEALRARGHAVEVFAAAPPEPAASLGARFGLGITEGFSPRPFSS